MPIGTVKWFDARKGFGFILKEGDADVFVHFSRIQADGFRSLRDGEKVEYEEVSGEKGLSAQWVKRLGKHAKAKVKVRAKARIAASNA